MLSFLGWTPAASIFAAGKILFVWARSFYDVVHPGTPNTTMQPWEFQGLGQVGDPLAKKDVSCHTCWSLESQKRLAVDFLIQGLATPESLRGKEFRCSGAQILLLVENHHPVG